MYTVEEWRIIDTVLKLQGRLLVLKHLVSPSRGDGNDLQTIKASQHLLYQRAVVVEVVVMIFFLNDTGNCSRVSIILEAVACLCSCLTRANTTVACKTSPPKLSSSRVPNCWMRNHRTCSTYNAIAWYAHWNWTRWWRMITEPSD